MKKYLILIPVLFLFQYSCDTANGQNGQGNANNNGNQVADITLTTFESTLFSGSGVCAFCHSTLSDSEGNDVSIDTHWQTSMMAHSSRDPLWRAKVESEIDRNPALRAVIEDKCGTCHMPMARTEADYENEDTAILNDGFLKEQNFYHTAATDGVSCTLCHQVDPDNLGTEESYSGGYKVDTLLRRPSRKIFGPFTNLNAQNMINRTGFIPEYSEHVTESAICATCHTLFTPVVDGQGNLTGNYLPEQTPYLEWEHSSYAVLNDNGKPQATCQTCHMPVAEGTVAISNRPANGLTQRSDFGKHLFTGGNFIIPQILRDNLSEFGVAATESMMNTHINRIKNNLQNNAATIELVSADIVDNNLELVLKVTNKSGHKLPTGFPSRRVWLNLKVTDANGNVIFHSGDYDSAGRIIGVDENAGRWQRHLDVITHDGEVQIWETIMVNTDSEVTWTLLRGDRYIKDNRLLPAGFNKMTSDSETAVHGDALFDENFGGGNDIVRYRINISGETGPYNVEAKLEYQPLSYQFLRDLTSDENRLELVSEFSIYYKNVEELVQTLVSKQWNNISPDN